MDKENEEEEDAPAREGADSAAEILLIEEEADGERANDLCDPVHEVVQGSCADVEKGTIVVVKF
jgi:hypothetical protein